jgi:hypothetical protein
MGGWVGMSGDVTWPEAFLGATIVIVVCAYFAFVVWRVAR